MGGRARTRVAPPTTQGGAAGPGRRHRSTQKVSATRLAGCLYICSKFRILNLQVTNPQGPWNVLGNMPCGFALAWRSAPKFEEWHTCRLLPCEDTVLSSSLLRWPCHATPGTMVSFCRYSLGYLLDRRRGWRRWLVSCRQWREIWRRLQLLCVHMESYWGHLPLEETHFRLC